MKKIGIVLLVLQVLALFGSVANGEIAQLLDFSSVAAICRTLGFFLPAIIGVILLNKASKKEAEKEEKGE